MTCTVTELRAGLELAHALAKMGIAFVVMPATSREDFVALTLQSAARLERIAADAEKRGEA